jgi:hypothetical protein
MRLLHGMLAGLLLGGTVAMTPGYAQLATHDGSSTSQSQSAPHRQRLILKDGTYQIVMSYKVVGSRVQYTSAERGGETEEIPLDLVDLNATQKWEQQHAPGAAANAGDLQHGPPVLDPELAKEEADRAALTPEVAPDLHLVAEDSVLALDTWRGTPELVPLMQTAGDLNQQTGHSILRGVINPNSSTHQVLQLKGEKSPVQMHVNEPALYIRLDDATDSSGQVLTVDTGGASSSSALKQKPGNPSRYAIVRVDVRQDARIVASFNTSFSGSTKRQQDAIATNVTVLPGGHWAKIVPTEPLLFGEYCLVEVLGDNQINLSVWDFGVHPTEPENRDVLRPEKRRPSVLERHPPE